MCPFQFGDKVVCAEISAPDGFELIAENVPVIIGAIYTIREIMVVPTEFVEAEKIAVKLTELALPLDSGGEEHFLPGWWFRPVTHTYISALRHLVTDVFDNAKVPA